MPHLPDHATHDPELIAAYAAGDATGPALTDASELVAGCADCAALHRDLRAIAVALPALPAPVRPRDFRLTPEQAASLAPSGWRGVLAAFASPRFRLAAPLGTGLAAIGLAGLLLGTPGSVLPAGGAGSAAEAATGAAGAPTVAGDAAAGAGPAAAAPALPAAPSGGAGYADTGSTTREPAPVSGAAASTDLAGAAPAASPVPGSTVERELALQASSPAASGGESIGVPRPAPAAPVAEPGPSPWLAVSALLLVVGVTLVVLRLVARSGERT